MARQPSLRSQLNQIRAWVRQGRTDAWIAHQLDITVDQLKRFKEEHDLGEVEQGAGRAVDPLSIPVPERGPVDEDEEEDEEEEPEESERAARSGRSRSRSSRSSSRDRGTRKPSGRERADRGKQKDRSSSSSKRSSDQDRDDADSGKRRRGRRGGRRRKKIPTYEATFDQGQEGYGFWLDPAIVDNPVYAEHWAGKRAIEVRFDADSITIRRSEPNGNGKRD